MTRDHDSRRGDDHDEAADPDLTEALADAESDEEAGAPPRIPDVRELRRALRRTRRAHSDRTLGELLSDLYLIAFIAVLYGGAGAYSLNRHLSQPLPAPAGTESSRAL